MIEILRKKGNGIKPGTVRPGSYSQTELANALASIAAKLNAIDTLLHGYGLST
ncbi:MAG TPA: hypothetical protein VK816_01835 [Jatrophihabitantaceae bacterium]|jgi:hypothetical protein|nr:hypothetical protein [Jatrophihabitantaceae bacterium]